jgi:hypothetical protein
VGYDKCDTTVSQTWKQGNVNGGDPSLYGARWLAAACGAVDNYKQNHQHDTPVSQLAIWKQGNVNGGDPSSYGARSLMATCGAVDNYKEFVRAK